MGNIILCCVFHILLSFVLEYSCEYIFIDSRVSVRMPSLNDFGERFDSQEKYKLQRYIDQVILPANDYFCKITDINNFQNLETLERLFSYFSTLVLVLRSFVALDLPKYVTFPLGLIAPILISVVVHLIYKKSNFRIKKFECTAQDLKDKFKSKGYFNYFDIDYFDITESTQFNNFVINMHNQYINQIYEDIQQRSNTRHVLTGIALAVLLYALYSFKFNF